MVDGSTPLTLTFALPIRPRSERRSEATVTPGALVTARPAPAGNADQPFCEVTTQSAVTCLPIARSIDPCTPLPSTATNETSARPIINAAAVDAVRPGFRVALSVASRPAAP